MFPCNEFLSCRSVKFRTPRRLRTCTIIKIVSKARAELYTIMGRHSRGGFEVDNTSLLLMPPRSRSHLELEVAKLLSSSLKAKSKFLQPDALRWKTMSMDKETNEADNTAAEAGDENSEDPTKKSERKRQREKQRRSELTSAFDELATFVLRFDSEDDIDDEEGDPAKRRRRFSSRAEGEDTGGMTRVDLIQRALGIMNRLKQENADLKQSLLRGGGCKSNEVMVMVPTFTPVEENSPTSSSYRSYMQPSFPPMPPPDHSQHPPPPYGSSQHRYLPPPGGWGAYPGGHQGHYGGPERGHHMAPPPNMDLHDDRSIPR